MSPPINSPKVAVESLNASPDPMCPWRMAQRAGLAIAWSPCPQRPRIRHVALAVSNRYATSFNLFGEPCHLAAEGSATRMPSEGAVSCCSRRSLDVTRVFAMPCSGQCPNVGRVEDSQGSMGFAWLARTPPRDQPAHLTKDAKCADCTKKLKPRFRGRDPGFANLRRYWITGRYPRSVRSRLA
jgi:hypothetical protein